MSAMRVQFPLAAPIGGKEMSSGEADAYTITLTNTTKPDFTYGGWYPQDTSSSTYYTSWSYTYPVYYYQVTCPRCKNILWAEQDKITECQGKIGRKACGAKIKAVIEKIDFEIPVVKPK